MYFYLILYILLKYQYSTTLFLQPILLSHFYYLLLTNFLLTSLQYFTSFTRTFISDIFSLHTIPYTFLHYAQCALHTSITSNSLPRNFLTHITSIIFDFMYLFIFKNVLFTILILLYFVNSPTNNVNIVFS